MSVKRRTTDTMDYYPRPSVFGGFDITSFMHFNPLANILSLRNVEIACRFGLKYINKEIPHNGTHLLKEGWKEGRCSNFSQESDEDNIGLTLPKSPNPYL